MTNYIETKINEIPDADYQTFVTELCECLNWDKADFDNKSLAGLFNAVVVQRKKLNPNAVLIDSFLSRKVKHLASGSVVYHVCCELVNRRGKAMDDMVGKSVLALTKHCYKAINPQPRPAKKLTRLQRGHQFETALILRRRSNGDL